MVKLSDDMIAPLARVILVPDMAAPDGLPRAALLLPGERYPVLYPSLSAALADLRDMKARK